jgi:hypothetical protein
MSLSKLSNKDRQTNWRTRLKNDPLAYELYLHNERERKRQKRLSMTQAEKLEHNRKNQKATKRWRIRRKMLENDNVNERNLQRNDDIPPHVADAYSNKSTFGKAKRKVENALPLSPCKKVAVVTKLAQDILGLKTPPGKSTRALSQESQQKISDFFENDSISRVMPGKADTISVKLDDGTRVHKQKRHLLMSISEAFSLFAEENPNICKISKFASLRPKNVLLSSDTPQNVCGCVYHTNIILLLECLNRKYSHIFPKYERQAFLSKCRCNIESEACMSDACERCQDGKVFDTNFTSKLNNEQKAENLTYYQWQQDDDGHISKLEKKDTADKIVQVLRTKLAQFTWHCFIKRVQEISYHSDKKLAQMESSETALIQVDYSENYSITFQDEVQGAHWFKKQISVFTVVIWHKNHTVSWVITSDNLDHNKRAVVTFLKEILDYVTETYHGVSKISFWSDGSAAQFKNKFIFASLVKFQNLYKITLTWSFFPTAHGKGPCDALGGSSKRVVERRILSRQHFVKDATSFRNVLVAATPNIKCTVSNDDNIEKVCQELDVQSLWEKVPPMPGTLNTHFVEPNYDSVNVKFYNSAENSRIHKVQIPMIEELLELIQVNQLHANQLNQEVMENQIPEPEPAQPQVNEAPEPEQPPPQANEAPEPNQAPTQANEAPQPDQGPLHVNPTPEPDQAPPQVNNVAKPIQKKRKRNQKRKQRSSSADDCALCGHTYGDPHDPKKYEEWLLCKGKCSRYFHLSCAEAHGILDDDDTFMCADCL